MYGLAKDLLIKLSDHFKVSSRFLPIKELFWQKHYRDHQIVQAVQDLAKEGYVVLITTYRGDLAVQKITDRGYDFLSTFVLDKDE